MATTLGVWTDEDLASIGQLAKLRNGIAHNNAVTLGRALGGQQFTHINDARIAVADVDALPHIMSTLVALVKLAAASTRLHELRSEQSGETDSAGRSPQV